MNTISTKCISISSCFPAKADVIWELLQKIETLQYIAAPYAYFRRTDPSADMIWREKAVFHFKLRIFGFIPVSLHTIQINTFDRATYLVKSTESNRFVSVWKHTIILKPGDDGTTGYTDEVEIGAGFLTSMISLWSKFFYKHRQKKWRRLLTQV